MWSIKESSIQKWITWKPKGDYIFKIKMNKFADSVLLLFLFFVIIFIVYHNRIF